VDIADAIQIVLSLARDNVIDDDELQAERDRQLEALDTVEDFVVNQLGDD